jgi:undecaprenyl-diphosphatase
MKLRINIKSVSLLAIIVGALFLVSIGLFAMITHEIVFEKEKEFDHEAFELFKEWSTPATIKISRILAYMGSPYFFIPSYFIIIGWLLFIKRKVDALHVFIIAITSTLLLHSLKAIFGRQRPELPLFEELTNYSFPSGHALSSFIFSAVLIGLIWKGGWRLRWKLSLSILLLTWSLSVGISRIILRYHFASDVLAGFLMGFAWVMFSFYIQRKIIKPAPHRIE